MVWLCYVAADQEVIDRLHDITTKRGGLQMKPAGEWRDWSEASVALFRSSVRVARAESVVLTPKRITGFVIVVSRYAIQSGIANGVRPKVKVATQRSD